MIGIYKITNPENKVYIGQSKNIEQRFEFYKNISCKYQPDLYKSLKKYGWFHHTFEILEKCNIEDLNSKEHHYIKFYNSINEGLNRALPGNNNEIKTWTYKYPEYAKKTKSEKMKKLWSEGEFKGRGSKPIKNLQTNKEYKSIKEATQHMKISFSKAYKYLEEGIILSYIK